MALSLSKKKEIVEDLKQKIASSISLVSGDYSGLGVEKLTALRAKARAVDVHLKVVPLNLVKRAVDGHKHFACICQGDHHLAGAHIFGFSPTEAAAARLFRDFAKEHDLENFVRLVSIGGQVLPANALDSLANLPTRNEAIASLLRVMQAPVTKFVQTLAAPHAKFVRTLAAVAEQKKAA